MTLCGRNSCGRCTKEERLLDFRDLQKGQHIAMGGRYASWNMFEKQKAAYSHHAIVKEIKGPSSDVPVFQVPVTLIHFYSSPYQDCLKIQETTELFDLRYDEIYIIKYHYSTLNPDAIIRKAEAFANVATNNNYFNYSCLGFNCEHFCHLCCVGHLVCIPAEIATELIESGLNIFSPGPDLVATRPVNLLDNITTVFNQLERSLNFPSKLLPVLKLMRTLIQLLKYILPLVLIVEEEINNGNDCLHKFAHRTISVLRKSALSLIQVRATNILKIFVLIGCVYGIYCVFEKLWKKFVSPLGATRNKIQDLRTVCVGDVISFRRGNMFHDGIVTGVPPKGLENTKKGVIKVIHYSLPWPFGVGKIVEETVAVDLSKKSIFCTQYSGEETYDRETVVQRARKRLGESKISVFSHRSCNFCHWAKVKKTNNYLGYDFQENGRRPEYIVQRCLGPFETVRELETVNNDHMDSRLFATKFIPCKTVNVREELREGEIIEFKYRCLWHKGVATSVVFDPACISKVTVKVVHYGNNFTVCEDEITFDLRYEEIYITAIHPTCCYTTEDVIRRARARVGQTKYNLFYRRATHLANEIVNKQTEAILDMNRLQPGDVITFSQKPSHDDAVVTRVNSHSKTKGIIHFVHYTLDISFQTKIVKADTLSIDLERKQIYLKDFSGYVTYTPRAVVNRALSRVGERRYNSSNTSSHLAFWAKVVQTPAIVLYDRTKQFQKRYVTTNTKGPEMLLLPRVVLPYAGLQKLNVFTWDDLNVGMIVEFTYYWIPHQGILSGVDKQNNRISVIHLGARHLFAKRKIMEDVLDFNPKSQEIYMYWPDPLRTKHYADDVLKEARARLNTGEWGFGNTSWNFCLSCAFPDEKFR